MAISMQKEKQIITIETANTSYQMKIDEYGFLLHLYYGGKVTGAMDYLLKAHDRGFSGNPYAAGNDRTYSLDALPQEFPVQGMGDYRNTALIVKNANGSYGCDLRYKTHEIRAGKYGLAGLPAVYAGEKEAETLKIILEDAVSGIQAELLYGVLPELDVITRSVHILNGGEQKVYIEKAASACLDFLHSNFDIISFYGRHAMERNYQRSPLVHGTFSIGSRRGTSSHQYNPFLILAETETNEQAGGCYAVQMVYSGGFLAEAERDQYEQTRIVMGLPQEKFSYPLENGEVLTIPEVILSYSGTGFNRLSQNLHTCIRRHICRGKYKDTVRPVLLNSWEANYFDFTGESLVRLAKDAVELGIEMLVLDDGWFGKRNDDNSSLGDWYVNEEKLGMGLKELIGEINAAGMKFGLWVEPEMISEDSDLYREHPDWAFTVPGRNPVRSRNQLVLDFSRKEVTDYIYERLDFILSQGNIEYIKWDMNRSLEDVFSHETKEQGTVAYRYVLGLYDVLERILAKYPDLLIEGCSGGGGRFDAGMLYYTPQIWCSDNTDAIDRLRIQYGTSFGYPVSAVGAHVSAAPNHQTGRRTSVHTRGVVAMSGTFGYELDPGELTEKEKNEIRQQVHTFHRLAPLIQNGTYYRLTNPFLSEPAAWEMVSKEKDMALLSVVVQEIHANRTISYVRLCGLKPEAVYVEESSGMQYSGNALMNAGIPLPAEQLEYPAYQMLFTEKKQLGSF